jgi:hypothetical protein
MGMVCTLKRVSAAQIAEISVSPEAALALVEDNADVDYPLEDVRMPGCLGLLLRLTPIKVQQVAERPADKPHPAYVEDPDRFDIEKVWDVMNYLLTGTPMDGDLPAAFLVNGGTELEIEDDETHLRLLTPQQVSEIDQFLQSLTLDDLRARIDIHGMVKARLLSKPRGKDDAPRQAEYLEQVLNDFDDLRAFITGTREQSKGLLVMIN